MNEANYDHGYGVGSVFVYSLYVDSKIIDSKNMTFIYL